MSCYEITTEGGCVYLRFSRRPTYSEVMSCIDELHSIPNSSRRLWHFLDGLDLQPDELRNIAAYTNTRTVQPQRVAVVSQQDLGYGLLRMFQSYRDGQDGELRVFRNYDEAYRYITST